MKNEKKSERRLAYILVAPSLLLILAVAIWPVIQSFYFSLFDYRLNNPAKSSLHLDYSLNLERYLESYPFLMSALKQEITQATGDEKEQLTSIQQKLQKVDEEIRADEEVAKRYEQIDEILNNFEVPSEDIKIVSIDEQAAQHLTKTINETKQNVKNVKTKTDN
ncbi:hypothetical protein LR68_02592 [Anoxybacillus sp. BCO1]|nr:hypothetical protein LR68_02592 [Anoxybacillus sp. BCO1]